MIHRAIAAALALVASGLAAAQVEPRSVAPPAEVVAWIRANAVPVARDDIAPSSAEAQTLDRALAGARIIGLGESGHGMVEPLVYRNRLIRYLVAHRGLTAVALESGLTEGRRVDAYVQGGPGDAEQIARAYLTHGFGYLPQNVELMRWLRGWNAAHPRRRVHLYGVDLSRIQSAAPGTVKPSLPLVDLVAFLQRTAPDRSAAVRTTLARFVDRYNENDYPRLTAAERTAIAQALDEAGRLLAVQADAAERRWAIRTLDDARRLRDVFDSWTDDPRELARLQRLIALRDGAMADNSRWILDGEGPAGRLLLFQSIGHVAAAPMVGNVMRLFPSQPPVTGTLLRRALGRSYRAIGSVSSRGRGPDDPTSGSVDRAFAAAGRAPVLLDLGRRDRPTWWGRTQTLSHGEARLDDAVPTQAFDLLVYFPALTPLPPPGP